MAELTACTTALGTNEILEQILLELPMQDLLLRAQLVCRQWRCLIDQTKRLQQRLFMAPTPVEKVWAFGFPWDVCESPMVDVGKLSEEELRHLETKLDSCYPRDHRRQAAVATLNPFFESGPIWRTWTREDVGFGFGFIPNDVPNASWRRMYPCQPCPESIKIELDHSYGSTFDTEVVCPFSSSSLIHCRGPTTFGTLVDLMVRSGRHSLNNSNGGTILWLDGVVFSDDAMVKAVEDITKRFKQEYLDLQNAKKRRNTGDDRQEIHVS